MRAGIIGRLHIVDVSSADPEDFRFELLGYGVPLGAYEKPRQFQSRDICRCRVTRLQYKSG
jgi:hypothetical protein